MRNKNNWDWVTTDGLPEAGHGSRVFVVEIYDFKKIFSWKKTITYKSKISYHSKYSYCVYAEDASRQHLNSKLSYLKIQFIFPYQKKELWYIIKGDFRSEYRKEDFKNNDLSRLNNFLIDVNNYIKSRKFKKKSKFRKILWNITHLARKYNIEKLSKNI